MPDLSIDLRDLPFQEYGLKQPNPVERLAKALHERQRHIDITQSSCKHASTPAQLRSEQADDASRQRAHKFRVRNAAEVVGQMASTTSVCPQ